MTQYATIPFHGQNLYLVEKNGEPYAAVKPVCENIGIDWSGQHAKLKAHTKRWGMEMISIPSPGGTQEMACMPLRKYPAWINSIDPAKVKPEIREKLEIYQAESDDALWQYWSRGIATNPRANQPIHRQPVPRTGNVVLTRAVERQILEMFVDGYCGSQIAKALAVSEGAVCSILHGKYQFSQNAGVPECTPELIAAVAARHFAVQQQKLDEQRNRMAQRFLAHANNAELANALDHVGRKLLDAPALPEGGAA